MAISCKRKKNTSIMMQISVSGLSYPQDFKISAGGMSSARRQFLGVQSVRHGHLHCLQLSFFLSSSMQ